MGIGNRPLPPPEARDKRTALRRRTLRTASLVFNDGRSTVDATLRDLSDTGARVRVQGAFECPREVVLRLSDGTAYLAEVRWFRNLELGLMFVGEPRVIGMPPASTLRIWGLYREAEKLSPVPLLRELRLQHFLDDVQLEALATQWRDVYEAFVARLHAHTQAPPEDLP